MFSGCCPPLALPRRSLGGEIIGFEPKTGQFVQASAGTGATRIVEYPYYASAGMGAPEPPKPLWLPNRRRPLQGLEVAEVLGVAGLATFAVLSIVGLVIGLKDS